MARKPAPGLEYILTERDFSPQFPLLSGTGAVVLAVSPFVKEGRRSARTAPGMSHQKAQADRLAQQGRCDEAAEIYRRLGDQAALDLLENQVFAQTLGLCNLLALYYYGRSGSFFVHSLFDDHPQVVAVPGATLQHWDRFFESHQQSRGSDLVDDFCMAFAPLFDARRPAQQFAPGARVPSGSEGGLDRMGPERDQVLTLDEAAFRQHLGSLWAPFEVLTRRYFLQSVHAAYELCRSRSLLGKTWIVLQLHNAPDRGQYTWLHQMVGVPDPFVSQRRLWEIFPEARHLFCLRNPLDSLASLYLHVSSGADSPPHIAASVLAHGLHGGVPALARQRNHSRGVRLEDLHQQGEGTMRAVASWLGLSWSEHLLQSTFAGLQWWNVSNAPVVSGFQPHLVRRKPAPVYSWMDRWRLSVLLQPKYRAWSYSPDAENSPVVRWLVLFLLWIPFRMEWIRWRRGGSLARMALGYLHLRWASLDAWLNLYRTPQEVETIRPQG